MLHIIVYEFLVSLIVSQKVLKNTINQYAGLNMATCWVYSACYAFIYFTLTKERKTKLAKAGTFSCTAAMTIPVTVQYCCHNIVKCHLPSLMASYDFDDNDSGDDDIPNWLQPNRSQTTHT